MVARAPRTRSMKSMILSFFAWFALWGTVGSAYCQAQGPEPRDLSLPSAAPSGLAVNDRVLFRYHVPVRPSGTKLPAVILLHYMGGSGVDSQWDKFARTLSQRGIVVVALTLPYHGQRRPPNDAPNRHFVGEVSAGGAVRVAQAFGQSASDVDAVVTWLTQQPEVDTDRIGAVGVSLGAFVLHLAMGRDPRIRAGVAALGAGNLAEIFLHTQGRQLNAQDIEALRAVEPLTYADRNRPRRVLMIQAARDAVVPPRHAERLWEALGRPPIQWADVDHKGLALSLNSVTKTTIAYLEAAWGVSPNDLSRVPHVRARTIKAGLMAGMDTLATPALQYQFISLGTRNHMALLHANAGLGLRGPFVGLAVTLNRHVDIGVGRRVFGNTLRPYLSFHKVF
jgi:dienelactone hydrolase